MICATIANASAQEIFKEVKRLEKQAETFANDTTKNINERKIACFKYDAIFYLIDKGSQEGTFTEYDLGEQTNAMIDFVNLFVKRLSQTSKAKDKDLLKAKFRTATINNSLFNDVDKEVIYSYVDNDKFITQFSLDTDWVKALEKASGEKVDSYEKLTEVLLSRIDLFEKMGCRASDHAFTRVPYKRADAAELDRVFKKTLGGEELSECEVDEYKTELMRFFAKEYARRGWGMEIHIGATRNNNSRMFKSLGPDSGFDSIADHEIADNLSRLLDSLDVEDLLPKTILFTLNPKDNYVLGAMLGNFQNSQAASKIQFGSAWWFNDNIDGMREQMKALANTGVLSKFVGMVTDSRSFLSYPRHEYFRRILCDLIGSMVERGLYPADMDTLKKIVCDISFNNAKEYFGI